ncbi:MAG: hypothetical protein OQK01_14790 [Xanthomonadales bacterium]|jgi:hypothetical protein|nr:hypothetical protein [Xanthomonadales bacterium]
MKRLAMIVSLCLLAGLASAGTFELADPAADMLKEPEARAESEPVQAPPLDNVLCTVDTATGACTCIDTEKARKLSMTRKECVDRVMQSLKNHEP